MKAHRSVSYHPHIPMRVSQVHLTVAPAQACIMHMLHMSPVITGESNSCTVATLPVKPSESSANLNYSQRLGQLSPTLDWGVILPVFRCMQVIQVKGGYHAVRGKQRHMEAGVPLHVTLCYERDVTLCRYDKPWTFGSRSLHFLRNKVKQFNPENSFTMTIDNGKQVVYCVTGASRGIGLEYVKQVCPGVMC